MIPGLAFVALFRRELERMGVADGAYGLGMMGLTNRYSAVGQNGSKAEIAKILICKHSSMVTSSPVHLEPRIRPLIRP